MQKALQNHQICGYSILAKGMEPKLLEDGTYLIPSQNGNGKYKVKNLGYTWVCECPDNQKQKIECKHIHAVKFWLALKDKLKAEATFSPEKAVEKPKCAYCNSPNVVKNGKRNCNGWTKQRYLCRDCKRTFIQNKDFSKVKAEPKIVTLVLDLYFKGLSLRKIKDHLKQFYGIEINHSTIYRWIKKYMKLI